MGDLLTHHYFDTSHAVLANTLEQDLPALTAAVRRLRRRPSP